MTIEYKGEHRLITALLDVAGLATVRMRRGRCVACQNGLEASSGRRPEDLPAVSVHACSIFQPTDLLCVVGTRVMNFGRPLGSTTSTAVRGFDSALNGELLASTQCLLQFVASFVKSHALWKVSSSMFFA